MKTWKTIIALLLISAALVAILPIGMLVQTVHASTSSSPPTAYWYKIFGGPGDDEASAVIQTSDGGYAIIGSENSFGAGSYDAWLVKTDSLGNILWNKTYGGVGDDEANSIIQTSDGGYAIAGYTNTSSSSGTDDGWLVKTDASGNMLWNKTYGGSGMDYLYSVVQTSDGGYALAGATTSFSAGGIHFWLVRVDSKGNMLWNQTYGGKGNDEAFSAVQTSDGGYTLAGITSSFGAGGQDFWFVKTDLAGVMQWNKTYGGASDDEAFSAVQTSDGGYALVGLTTSFGSGNDLAWLVKTDAEGNMLWNQTYGGTNYNVGSAVVQTSDGGYAIAGTTSSFGAGDKDAWLIRTDSAGAMLWNQTYGGSKHDAAFSVVQTSDGGYALAGTTTSFGSGSFDYYVVKTAGSASSSPSSNTQIILYVVIAIVAILIASVATAIILKRKRQA
jgi:predicted secreted protein